MKIVQMCSVLRLFQNEVSSVSAIQMTLRLACTAYDETRLNASGLLSRWSQGRMTLVLGAMQYSTSFEALPSRSWHQCLDNSYWLPIMKLSCGVGLRLYCHVDPQILVEAERELIVWMQRVWPIYAQIGLHQIPLHNPLGRKRFRCLNQRGFRIFPP